MRAQIQIPPGVQCFVGEDARRRRAIEQSVVSVFDGWDYEEIIPPLYDYADVFGSPALEGKTYSFVGRDGSLMALRPDFTSLLGKIAAGRLAERPAPIRLYYSGEVLRYEPPKAGRQSELYQMGLEHLHALPCGECRAGTRNRCEHLCADPRAADVEVLAIAAECLERLDVQGFVLAVGHVGVFAGLVADSGLAADALETLRERVDSKDVAGVEDVLERFGVGGATRAALRRLTSLAGDAKVLDEAARAFAFSPAAAAALAELRAVVEAVAAAGLGGRVTVDLSEVRGLDYYTGLVFRAYAAGLGFEVGAGGRYDMLLARFGRPMAAVGFMLGLDRLALLRERQGHNGDTAAAPAEPVPGAELGAALRDARARRTAGRRVRFDGGRR